MSEIERKKITALDSILSLCPRCQRDEDHSCPVSKIARELKSLHPVPVRVNDVLYSVVFM